MNGKVCPNCGKIHPDITGNRPKEVGEKVSKTKTGCKRNGKLCPNCGKIHVDMTGDNNPAKSMEVRQKLSKKNRRGTFVKCRHCGIMVYRRPCEIKKSKKLFCSQKCYHKSKYKSELSRLKWEDIEYKEYMSNVISKSQKKEWKKTDSVYRTEEWKEKQKNSHKGQKNSIESLIAAGNSIRKVWQDPNSTFHTIQYKEKLRKGMGLKPNKAEISFNKNILQKHFPNQWKYVGDFRFWINGANPDFIHCNGKKLVIEGFYDWYKIRDYSSVDNYIKVRSKRFKKEGYRTLFIDWYKDLKDEGIIVQRIQDFINNKEGGE